MRPSSSFRPLLRRIRVMHLLAVALMVLVGPAHGQPRLEVTQNTDLSLTLRWPVADAGYVLESAAALGPFAQWQEVAVTPTSGNGVWSVQVRAGDAARFFRLRGAQGAPPTFITQTSPDRGETGVAVTREVIFRFSAPLAPESQITIEDLHSEAGGRRMLARPELSSDRRTATLFHLENLPGSSRIRVKLDGSRLVDTSGRALDADGDGQPGGTAVVEFNTAGTVGLTNTAVSGRVFAAEKNPDGSNRPLANVTITVDGAEETLRTTTDSSGSFKLSPAPAGRFFVHVDGRTAVGSRWPGGAYYPFVGKAWDAIAGTTNNLAGGTGEIFLPLIQADALTSVSATEATRVVFSPTVIAGNPAFAGVQVEVPANALFSDNGVRGGRVGIAPVARDRLPEPLPPGLNLPIVITVQTDGASNFDQPVPVRFPNLPDPVTGRTLPPGAKTVLWSFNHDTGRWEPQGLMTISADGQFAVSDPGTGIRQPGWHGAAPGSGGRGPRGPAPGNPRDEGDLDDDGQPDCEGPDCECTQEVTCIIPKEGTSIAYCALKCVGNVVDDIFGDGPKPERTAFESGLRCIGGPSKCPGQPERTLDKKRRDCMDECTDPLADRVVYTVPCEGFTSPCRELSPRGLGRVADFSTVIPDRLVEQREFWKTEEDFLVKLTGTPKILESTSDEVPRLLAFFDAFSDRVQPASAAGIRLSPTERAELAALPRPSQFSAAEWTAMIDRLEGFQGAAVPADVAAADQKLTDLTAELIRRGWNSREDGLLHGLAQRSRHAAPLHGSAEFPARAHFFYLKDHTTGFVQRGRLNAAGDFEGVILSPEGYYSVAYLDPLTRRAGVAFFQARQAGTTTIIPTAPLEDLSAAAEDADLDGLPDHAEQILGTSETRADSDQDGIPDGRELELNTNPLDGVGLPIGVVSVVPAPGTALDVAAGNGIAVVAASQGLAVYDVSNPAAPLQLAVIPGNATAVALHGNLALAAISESVRLYDLSDPAAPRMVWQRTFGRTDGVAVDSTAAYATGGFNVHRFDLTTGETTTVSTAPHLMESILPRGNIVYAVGNARLLTFRSGEAFTALDSLAAPGNGGAGSRPRKLFADGNLLYATQNFGFNVFDLTVDPGRPLLVNDVQTRQAGWRQFAPVGSGLALAADGPNSTDDGPHDVSIYRQTTNGTAVQFVSTLVTPGSAYALSAAGGRAFVADGAAGLTVLNYLAPDLAGVAPTAAVVVDSPANPPRVEGGSIVRITGAVSDDIATRRVELLINDQVTATDDTYPFEVFPVLPPASPSLTSLRLRIRAEDMGGNIGVSPELTVMLVADATPPRIVKFEPEPGSLIPYNALSNVTVTFEEPVVTPVSASTLTLRGAGTDGQIDTADDVVLSGQVTWIPAERAIQLQLPEPMVDRLYRATLATGLADQAGNSRSGGHTWTFGTGGPPQPREIFPPRNFVRVGGLLDEISFRFDQPVPPSLLALYQWTVNRQEVLDANGNLGPAVPITPLTVIRSSDGRTITLRGPESLAPGYYRVLGNGPLLAGILWEFYFRNVPNEAVGTDPFSGTRWKHPPGVGANDELIVNLPGMVAPVETRGIRSLFAVTDVAFSRQQINIPTPIQLQGGLVIMSTSFGPGSTDVRGAVTFLTSVPERLEIGAHTLNLHGGGEVRTDVMLHHPDGAIVNHPGSTLNITNGGNLVGPSLGSPGGRIVNLGTLRSLGSTLAPQIDGVLLRNEGLTEAATGTFRIFNGENEGTLQVAAGARLLLPSRFRSGLSSRLTGDGAVEFGEFDTSRRRVRYAADADLRGEFDVRGKVTLVAGSLSVARPLNKPDDVIELQNSSTLRLLAPSTIGSLALTDGNLDFNSDTDIGTLTVNARADLRTSTRLRITGDARIGAGIDALGSGVVEFAGTTVVSNGTQSGGMYVGQAILRNTGTWRQAINSSQGTFLDNVLENQVPASGYFDNAGLFELVTERPFGIHAPFRNRGRVVLSRTTVTIDARTAFRPARRGAYLPEGGAELVLNNTSFDHSFAGSLDLSAGTVRGVGSLLTVSADSRPRIINRGVLRPGNPTGTLVIRASDGFEQTASGELVIGLTASGNALLRLDRTPATLGGTLTVELLDGFAPALGQTFSIVNYPSRTGEFTTVNLPDPGPGRRFAIEYGATEIVLRVAPRS